MAKRSNELQLPVPTKRRKYAWEQWADGDTWILKQGEDFTIPVKNIASHAHTWARNHGYMLRSRIEGTTVFLRFAKNPSLTKEPKR